MSGRDWPSFIRNRAYSNAPDHEVMREAADYIEELEVKVEIADQNAEAFNQQNQRLAKLLDRHAEMDRKAAEMVWLWLWYVAWEERWESDAANGAGIAWDLDLNPYMGWFRGMREVREQAISNFYGEDNE